MTFIPTPTPSYVEIISKYHTDITASCSGDGYDYDTLALETGDSLPSKDVLDSSVIGLVRDIVWSTVQSRRDLRKQGGVKIGNYWFHSDDTSRIQQIGLVMFGANMPVGIQWKTMTGDFVTMTPTLAMQIFTGIATSDVVVFGIAEAHRQAIMSSADPGNYDYTTGWPPVYGES